MLWDALPCQQRVRLKRSITNDGQFAGFENENVNRREAQSVISSISSRCWLVWRLKACHLGRKTEEFYSFRAAAFQSLSSSLITHSFISAIGVNYWRAVGALGEFYWGSCMDIDT